MKRFITLAILIIISTAFTAMTTSAQTTAGSYVVNATAQQFQGGLMIYRGDTGTIYVLNNANSTAADSDTTGNVYRYQPYQYGSLPLNQEAAPGGYYAPEQGFGRVWANNAGVRSNLGWGVLPEIGFRMPVSQDSDGAIYLEQLNGVVYQITASNTWRRLNDIPNEPADRATINSFSITPTTFQPGDTVTVSWDVTLTDDAQTVNLTLRDIGRNNELLVTNRSNAGDVTISADTAGDVLAELSINDPTLPVGIPALRDKQTLILDNVNASNPNPGDDVSINQFSISPTTIQPGDTITVNWGVTRTSDAQLINLFLHDVSGAVENRLLDLSLAASGTREVTIPVDTVGDVRVTLQVSSTAPSDGASGPIYVPTPLISEDIRLTNDSTATDGDVQVSAVYQPFQNGFMLWRADTGTVLTLSDNGPLPNGYAGNASMYPQGAYANWADFDGTVPNGFVTPTSAFGKVWSNDSNRQQRFGYPTAPEQSYTATVQKQANGDTVYTLPDGRRVLVDAYGAYWEFQ